MATEQDLRLGILNTLLTTPHRQLAQIWPIHQEMATKDPRFYVRLAAWYSDHGDVRDHKEMFIVSLALSNFPGHRDVGLAMLRELPPYQVVRVLDFINGRKTTRKIRIVSKPSVKTAPQARRARRGVVRRMMDALTGSSVETDRPQGGRLSMDEVEEQFRMTTESFGLFQNPPRSLRTEITRYLRERESDADWFDGTVLVARKAMKRLY